MWVVLFFLSLAGLVAWAVYDSRRERRESQALRADTAKLYLALQEVNRVFGGIEGIPRPPISLAILRQLVRTFDGIEGMTLGEAERECHARSD
jgi:hypothetical protein